MRSRRFAATVASLLALTSNTPLIASVNSDGATGLWASGTPVLTPDTSPQTFKVTRAGYDNTGAPITYEENLI